MQPHGKEELKQKTSQRGSYSPPRLTEYGSLARLVQVKAGGATHDPVGCLNTKTTSAT